MILAEFTAEVNNIQVENLYQWDVNQTLKISGIDFGSTTPQVHFCNKKSEKALVTSTVLSNGTVTANIPNTLLQEPYDIIAYVYQSSGATSSTIKSIRIPIISRPKPNDYSEPTGEDIIEIHEIELEAKAIIDNLTASAYNSAESYKRPNIVYYRNGAYMCKSSTAVTGVEPTNTSVWQLLCEGTYISGINMDSVTNRLVFTFNNGGTVSIPVESANVVAEDDLEGITVGSAKALKTTAIISGGNLASYTDKTLANGLYACTLSYSGKYCTIMLSVQDQINTTVGSFTSATGGDIVDCSYNPLQSRIYTTSAGRIIEVRLITLY